MCCKQDRVRIVTLASDGDDSASVAEAAAASAVRGQPFVML